MQRLASYCEPGLRYSQIIMYFPVQSTCTYKSLKGYQHTQSCKSMVHRYAPNYIGHVHACMHTILFLTPPDMVHITCIHVHMWVPVCIHVHTIQYVYIRPYMHTILFLAPPGHLPYDQPQGIHVNLLEGLQVLQVHSGVQRLRGHVPVRSHLEGKEERKKKKSRVIIISLGTQHCHNKTASVLVQSTRLLRISAHEVLQFI